MFALESLTPCDDEFFEVIKLCKFPYDERASVPLIIEKIHNTALAEAFDKRVAAIAAQSRSTPSIRWPMYHGTSQEAANKIVRGGFDASKSCNAAYNLGTYFAENYEYSTNGYAKNDSYGHQFVLVCKVIEGRSCIGTSKGITDTRVYDSACDYTNTILSTPYNDGALPVYIVRYYKAIPKRAR